MTYVIYNDLHLVPYYIFGLLGYFFVLISAVALHELGHIIYYKIIGKTVKTKWIKPIGLEVTTLEHISDTVYSRALWIGLLCGGIPIIIAAFIFAPAILLTIPYAYIVKHDLKKAFELVQWEGE